MRPVWLIEAGIYGAEADPLRAEIRRQGMAAGVVPFQALQKEKDLPKEVGREWRLVVAEDRVVAGSQYAVEGSRCVEPGCPEDIRAFAESMLAAVRWRPDPIFMMDIAESGRRLWLVELNGFSTSWLYACDLAAVVAAASELAALEWEKKRGR